MYERLVEAWLDSASERSYQGPFCQMLAADGHRIIHSSRHSPIEFGKDVITIDREGVPCAYQLKANPGTRLTYKQFEEIHGQLLGLVNMPIPVESLRSKPHRSYLVTNGLVEEEARLAIDELNRGFVRDGFPGRQLEILNRGHLLGMAHDLGHSLWPSEFKRVNLLIGLLAEDGNDKFPVEKLHDLLIDVLKLEENSRPKLKAPELKRRITSAALLVAVALRSFQQTGNNFALVSAWVLYCAYAIAACDRHGFSFAKNAKAAVELALTSTRDALISLAKETLSSKFPLEGDLMLDGLVYQARYTLLLALMSLLWFWCEEEGWPDSVDRKKLMEFLNTGGTNLYLWGEAAIPQWLSYYWFLRATSPYSSHESMLVAILRRISDPRLTEQSQGLAQPYYDFEDVARHALSPILGRDQDPLRDDHSGLMSYFAESLMHLVVRTGRKTTCKRIWPDLTRLEFVSFIPDSKWQYCLWRTDRGDYVQVQPPLTKQWDDLVEEARHVDCPEVPESLSSNRILHALFLILLPHRSTPSAVCALARRFDRTWFIPPPITAEDST